MNRARLDHIAPSAHNIVPMEGVPLDHLQLVRWADVPHRLRKGYSHRDPLFTGTKTVRIQWMGWYELTAQPGLISDLSSYPWWLRAFGISRFTRDGSRDLSGYLHDPVYHGVDRFCEDHALNRYLADRLFLDCLLWGGAKRAELDYRVLRAAGAFTYDPRPDLHADGVFTITKIK